MASIQYTYNRFDPGIFMELYLPKKAEYQGILYDTLTKGFLIENVRSHLKKNWVEINQLMAGSYTSRIKDTKELDTLLSVFHGYSMYEVDGVFFNSTTRNAVEERTQVIRLMFRFDLENFLKSEDHEVREAEHKIAKLVSDDFLNYCTNKPAFFQLYIEKYRKQWPNHEAFIKNLINFLQHWEFSMALFVLGYVIFELCEKIKLLHKEAKGRPEDEIWITSFWDLRINRIIKSA